MSLRCSSVARRTLYNTVRRTTAPASRAGPFAAMSSVRVETHRTSLFDSFSPLNRSKALHTMPSATCPIEVSDPIQSSVTYSKLTVASLPASLQLNDPSLWRSAGYINGAWTNGSATSSFKVTSELV